MKIGSVASMAFGLALAACVDMGADPGAGGSSGAGMGSSGAGPTGASGSAGAPAPDGSGGSPAAGGSGNTGSCPDDTCPAPLGGVTIDCQKRFHFGVNYAWASFGGDFGSTRNGVAVRRAQRLAALQDMRANGVDVVRWWVFPNFTAGGVTFDGTGTPTGLGGSTVADIAAALDIAAEAGVHIEFTLFSFDNFKTTLVQNLAPIISDPTRLAALIDNVVTPFANEVNKSANRDRASSWDVINEPEWAISGSDGIDARFTPQATVTTVTYPIMKGFVTATVDALKAVSDRPVTVGGAAIKWAKAWAGVGDYYTFHMYDWVNMSFPYDTPLARYGVTDKPVVLGEFPIQGLTGVPYATLVGTLFDLGYAGALAWSVTDANFPWAPNKVNINTFAQLKGCAVSY